MRTEPSSMGELRDWVEGQFADLNAIAQDRRVKTQALADAACLVLKDAECGLHPTHGHLVALWEAWHALTEPQADSPGGSGC